MNIPKPFIPLRSETKGFKHTVFVSGRKYVFGADGMLESVVSKGKELLKSPVRIVAEEHGDVIQWDNNYEINESESFIQKRSDESIEICGAKQSDCFIIDTCTTVDYDGYIDIDFKLMTKGLTVAQSYGVSEIKQRDFILNKLWIEVPLKKELFKFFHIYPDCEKKLFSGSVIKESAMTQSGALPEESFGIPFRPIFWLGNDDLGFGWAGENNKYWEPKDKNSAIEIVYKEDTVILRIRLLDKHPQIWKGDPKQGNVLFHPISFHFGFQATPVKKFPENPYIHNAFHLDCGVKVKGNYKDYLNKENRFDKLKEKGVTTLILHEKWNKCQNWFELSEYTSEQLHYICDECHKRGIAVLPYFGYELSVMSPVWSKYKDDFTIGRQNDVYGGWWRVPFQREYTVCYNSGYADMFANGIEKLMDEYNLDGIYLDGTLRPLYCENINHGCGWYDYEGNLRGTYPIRAVRKLFKKLYHIVESRGGEINVHGSGAVNFSSAAFIHQHWVGEILQAEFMKGNTEDMNLDYFRALYTGRNIGVPVEFLAYENRPLWNFENAVACSLIHGIVPRPNDIDYPLELMSKIWKIFEDFPVEKSLWLPYWENNVKTSNEKIKVSYYKYKNLIGKDEMLAFVVNISSKDIKNVSLEFEERITCVRDLVKNKDVELNMDIPAYNYRILYLEGKGDLQ